MHRSIRLTSSGSSGPPGGDLPVGGCPLVFISFVMCFKHMKTLTIINPYMNHIYILHIYIYEPICCESSRVVLLSQGLIHPPDRRRRRLASDKVRFAAFSAAMRCSWLRCAAAWELEKKYGGGFNVSFTRGLWHIWFVDVVYIYMCIYIYIIVILFKHVMVYYVWVWYFVMTSLNISTIHCCNVS